MLKKIPSKLNCENCGADNEIEARYCSKCDFAMDLICSVCGNKLKPGDRFCPSCGQRL